MEKKELEKGKRRECEKDEVGDWKTWSEKGGGKKRGAHNLLSFHQCAAPKFSTRSIDITACILGNEPQY